MVKLSNDERGAIAAAVSRAEAATSGEICCVLAEEASRYREVPLAWAALIALLVPPVALAFGAWPMALGEIVYGWAAAQNGIAERDVALALACYAIAQAVLFAIVELVGSIAAVRRAITPSFVKRHRVRQSARHHFASLSARAGDSAVVLIYASRFDRMVEIVVSDAAKAADARVWTSAATAIVEGIRNGRSGDGFVRAIDLCGATLAKLFPPIAGKANMLPDALIEE